MKKEVDLTIADATRAIELDPNLAVAYRIRANAYEVKGEKALADKDRRKIKELEVQAK